MISEIIYGGLIGICLFAQHSCAPPKQVAARKGGSITCFSCKVEFDGGAVFQFEDECIFPMDSSRLTTCSPEARYCLANVIRTMDVFYGIERYCADDCGHTCISKGYGATQETCTYCCEEKPDCGLEEDLERRRH